MEHSYATVTGEGYGTTNVSGGGSSCYCCGQRSFSMSRCSACKVATYCTPACQKANWKGHKKNCKEMVKKFANEESLAAAGKLSAADWLAKGNRAQIDGHFPVAVDAFKKALKMDPRDFIARNNLGNCYRSLGDPALAFETHAENIRLLRAALNGQGPAPEGPTNLTAEQFLAQMLTNAARARDHMGMLRREVAGFEGAVDDFVGACSLFREAIAACPASGEPYNGLGNTLVRLRKPGEAFKVRQKAAQLFPTDYLKQYNFALSLMHHCEPPNYVESAQHLMAASRCEGGGEDPDTWVQLGECQTLHARTLLAGSEGGGGGDAKLARSLLKKARADLAKGRQMQPGHVGAVRIAQLIDATAALLPPDETKVAKGRKQGKSATL